MLKIGFTGTRRGMRDEQKQALLALLRELTPAEFHHGDCIGADAEAARIARTLGIRVHSHPPDNDKARAYAASDVYYPALPYLHRNHSIVNACDLLVVAPATTVERLRSGTWATYRYALRSRKPVRLLLPQGGVARFAA